MSHFDINHRWRMIGNIDLSTRNTELISYLPLNAEVTPISHIFINN